MCPFLAPQARASLHLAWNVSSHLLVPHCRVCICFKEAYAKPMFFSEKLEACGNEIHYIHHCPIIFLPFIHLQISAIYNVCFWLEIETTSSLGEIFCNSVENNTHRKVVCCIRKDKKGLGYRHISLER